MKKIIFLCLLFTSICFPQQFYIGNAILYSLVSGYTEGLRIKENSFRNDPVKQHEISSLWHKTILLQRGLAISLGVTIALYSKFNWEKMLSAIFLSGAIFWNIFDGTINLTTNRSFFHVSNTTSSMTKKYCGFKIPVLLVAGFISYLVENKIL